MRGGVRFRPINQTSLIGNNMSCVNCQLYSTDYWLD